MISPVISVSEPVRRSSRGRSAIAHFMHLRTRVRVAGVNGIELDETSLRAGKSQCAPYDHSASTRILPAFTAASRRSFLSCGANALCSLS